MIRSFGLAGLVAVTLLVGCGESFTPDTGVIVTGKIVQGGQPISLANAIPGYGYVEVQLVDSATNGQIGSAQCDASGSFEILGAGEGIPPGKYKVVIRALKDPDTDLLGGKLDSTNSKIEVDVPESKKGGKHDLGTIEVADHLK